MAEDIAQQWRILILSMSDNVRLSCTLLNKICGY